MIVACPLLQWLNLKNNSTLSLEDLHMIASCCCDLEGLNLTDVCIESSLKDVWRILSSIRKLAYLSIDTTYLQAIQNFIFALFDVEVYKP